MKKLLAVIFCALCSFSLQAEDIHKEIKNLILEPNSLAYTVEITNVSDRELAVFLNDRSYYFLNSRTLYILNYPARSFCFDCYDYITDYKILKSGQKAQITGIIPLDDTMSDPTGTHMKCLDIDEVFWKDTLNFKKIIKSVDVIVPYMEVTDDVRKGKVFFSGFEFSSDLRVENNISAKQFLKLPLELRLEFLFEKERFNFAEHYLDEWAFDGVYPDNYVSKADFKRQFKFFLDYLELISQDRDFFDVKTKQRDYSLDKVLLCLRSVFIASDEKMISYEEFSEQTKRIRKNVLTKLCKAEKKGVFNYDYAGQTVRIIERGTRLYLNEHTDVNIQEIIKKNPKRRAVDKYWVTLLEQLLADDNKMEEVERWCWRLK